MVIACLSALTPGLNLTLAMLQIEVGFLIEIYCMSGKFDKFWPIGLMSLVKCRDSCAVNSITSGSMRLIVSALCKSLC